MSYDGALVKAFKTSQFFAVLACVLATIEMQPQRVSINLNIDAFGEMGAHLPPGVANGLRNRDILDEVSGQAIVDGEDVGFGCLVVGVGLCFIESLPDLGREDMFENGQRPVQPHGPFSRTVLRGSLAFEDAAAKASLVCR